MVVMSKGTRYTQQSYKVSDAFPFEWIKKKWKENFYITSMATAGVNPKPEVALGTWLLLISTPKLLFFHSLLTQGDTPVSHVFAPVLTVDVT